MHFSDILAKFFNMFPNYQNEVCLWSRGPHNTIKIKLLSGQWLEFTYFNDKEWTLTSMNPNNRRV